MEKLEVEVAIGYPGGNWESRQFNLGDDNKFNPEELGGIELIEEYIEELLGHEGEDFTFVKLIFWCFEEKQEEDENGS